MYRILIFIALLIGVTGCRKNHKAVTTVNTFDINGKSRKYLLHLPANIKRKAPLVFVIHGYGDSAEGIRRFTKMDSISDKYGFAVCYPEATIGPDSLRSWNVGYSNYGTDDVGYISTLAVYLQKRYRLSIRNTFCTGMSNGGDMTIQMACLKPRLFRAVAPVVGCLMYWLKDSCKIKNIAPIFMINGTNDRITYWEGEKDYPAIGPNGYMGTRQMADFFIGLNECSRVKIDTLPHLDKRDSTFVVREKHTGCKDNSQVWLYSVIGGGHDWPGSSGNKDFFASREIWFFFRQYIE
jgi:polyhydroxybutyrate depolymerase